MGGPGAPDDMNQAHLTQVWLAAGDDPKANVTGQYFYHLKPMDPNPQANDPALQNQLTAICAKISGEALPPDATSSHLGFVTPKGQPMTLSRKR
jgi:hypothetical protein